MNSTPPRNNERLEAVGAEMDEEFRSSVIDEVSVRPVEARMLRAESHSLTICPNSSVVIPAWVAKTIANIPARPPQQAPSRRHRGRP